MNRGTVKWFNNAKGYGFIIDEDGQEVFVHHTGIFMTGFRTLSEGQTVEYSIESYQERQKAVDVVIMNG